MNEPLLSLFYLESISHKKELQWFKYDVFSHITDKKFLENLQEIDENTEKKIWMKLEDGGEKLMKKRDFEEYCQTAFREYYEEILSEEVFTVIFPDSISSGTQAISNNPFITTVNTMKNWCFDKQKKGAGIGLVVYGYDVYGHLKYLKSPEYLSQRKIFDSPGKDFVIVYSESESLIFLIRKAINKSLELDIELSTTDMKKFLLVFHDVLENSGIKLINLLAIDEDVHVKCKDCEYQVIPMMSLTSSDSFEKWREKRKINFKTSSNYDKISKDFSMRFAAKMLGFLALFEYSWHSCKTLPCMSDDPVEQIKKALLMTGEQLNTVYSSDKHIIIRGCYGSGKTIVALKKAEIISRLLKDDDSLWYVICDSRSKLGEEIKVSPKIQVFCNEMQMLGSSILQDILEKDSKRGNLNIIFDEFDGETLDEAEAKKLHQEFKTNKRLEDSNIILIPQPLEIKRQVNNTEKQGNKFGILETMKQKDLKINMRNTPRINRLVTATVNALKGHNPLYLENHDVVKSPLDQDKISEVTANEKEFRKQDTDVKIYTKNRVLGVQDLKTTRRKRGPSKSKDVRKENSNDSKKVKLDLDLKKENSIDCNKFKLDLDMKEENSIDCKKFQLDEACEYSIPVSEEFSTLKMISKFEHEKSNKSRHKKEGELPNLFEIDFPEESSKLIISLIAMLKLVTSIDGNNKLNMLHIADLLDWKDTEKHVILHFDAWKDIPNAFKTTFQLMGILSKVTTKYDEFKNDEEKMFFICSYRAFRGLEYSRVLVVLDPSLYQLLHYLPECLNRCTSNLHICILKMLNSIENHKPNEPFLSMVNAWKRPFNDQQLVKKWKIDFSECEKDCTATSLPIDSEKITIRGKHQEYADLEEQIVKYKTKTLPENYGQASYDQKEMESIKQR